MLWIDWHIFDWIIIFCLTYIIPVFVMKEEYCAILPEAKKLVYSLQVYLDFNLIKWK